MIIGTGSTKAIRIVLCVVYLYAWANAQREPERPYEYQTRLKGGYRIAFAVDAEWQYLYLKKGNRTITELAATSSGLPHKNLGYVGADFTDYFVLVHSYGSGNPHYVDLIRKRDGRNILTRRAACWIAANTKQSIFLFSYDCVPEADDKIVLLNVRTQKKRYLKYPKFMFAENEVLNRIEIGSASSRWLSLRFSSHDGSKSVVRRYRL